MKQLVELGENKEEFEKLNAEIIAVFREEQKGEEGLKAIKEKTKTSFTLALDNGNKQTSRYSGGKKEFTGYVISPKGKITKIIKGDLRNRAKADELVKALKASSGDSGSGKKAGSNSK